MFQVLLELLHDSWSEDGQVGRDIILDKSVERPVVRVPVALSHGIEVRGDMLELLHRINR